MEKKAKMNNLIGNKIIESMTQRQVASLLSSLFGLLDDRKRKHLLTVVDEEIADILCQILDPNKKSSGLPSTDSKCMEDWRELWDKWYDLTSELGDEDGKYVFQEHHWETPEFNGYEFSNDLERISEELLPLIDRIYSLNIADDDFFKDEIEEIESGIYGYPEWMGARHSECILGPCTTSCLLKWEWHVACSRKRPVITFLERIPAIENDLRIIELDNTAFTDFFTSLSEDVRKKLYEHIEANKTKPDWAERLESSYSNWRKIYDSLSSAFNIEEYLEDCMKYLSENWQYGFPLVENLLQRKEYIQAEEIIEKTFSSFLRLEQSKKWIPEETLLIVASRYYAQDQQEKIIKLLQNWAHLAEKLGNRERAAVLSVQRLIYKDQFQWNTVIEEFKKLLHSSFSRNGKLLLEQWQSFIARRSIISQSNSDDELRDTWVHWLIETGVDKKKDRYWFSGKVKNWLTFLSGHSPQFKTQKNLISTLTEDIAFINKNIKKQYPGLCEVVTSEDYLNARCSSFRRKWLKNIEVDTISTILIEFWKGNIAIIIPDPSQAYGYHYSEQAKWLLAIKELNVKAYSEIIQKWRIDHKRRRNLWKAVKEAGLPY